MLLKSTYFLGNILLCNLGLIHLALALYSMQVRECSQPPEHSEQKAESSRDFFSASSQEERVPAKSNASSEVKKIILELLSEKAQPSKVLKILKFSIISSLLSLILFGYFRLKWLWKYSYSAGMVPPPSR